MPRVTPAEQYQRYLLVQELWEHHRRLFLILTNSQLQRLLRYYPGFQPLTASEYAAHLRQVVASHSSDGAYAGRAYRKMAQAYADCQQQPGLLSAAVRNYVRHRGPKTRDSIYLAHASEKQYTKAELDRAARQLAQVIIKKSKVDARKLREQEAE